jgi:acyl-coenzyme A thioesterase PaaI-like protein
VNKFDQLKKLIAEAENGKLTKFNFIMNRAIPFNRPHRIRVTKVTPDMVEIVLPYSRRNWNHIRGAHACALATIGEYSAGMIVMRRFPGDQYRLIMAELNAVYHKQGKVDVFARAGLPSAESLAIHDKALAADGATVVEMISELHDTNELHVATITTRWQVKPWNRVKLK